MALWGVSMSTGRPEQPRRRITGFSARRAPGAAPPAGSLPDGARSQGILYGHDSLISEAEVTRALAETASVTRQPQVSEGALEAALRSSLDCLWLFSIPVRSAWRLPMAWFIGPFIVAMLPLALNGLLLLIHGSLALHTAEAFLWLLVFAGAQACALLAARVIWWRAVRDKQMIAELLPNERDDRHLAAWMRRWYSIPGQAISAIVLSGTGVLVLWLASPDVGPRLELGPVSYVAVAWTSATGGLVLYVFFMATLLSFEIGKCGPLDLHPWDPAATPGVRTLSRGYLYCLALLIVLAGGLETVATTVPGYHESQVLRAFTIGFAVFAVLCGLFVTLFPHAIIAHATYIRKIETITMIDAEIGDIRSSMHSDHGRLVTLVWLRAQVLGSPALPIRVPWLVPMLAALVGPLLAFLLALKHF
jgi:hypothetical protein